MPVDSPPCGKAVRSFGTSAWIFSGSQPSAPAIAHTCFIDRGSWIQRGLNSMRRSASSPQEYTSWIRSGSWGANTSAVISPGVRREGGHLGHV